MPTTRRPFVPAHALEYAVEVTSRDARGSATASCLFCVHEGRDDVKVGQNGRKRQRTANVKLYTEPFLTHKYRSHLESQHAESWATYKDLSKQEKEEYFAGASSILGLCTVRASHGTRWSSHCALIMQHVHFSGKEKVSNTLLRHMTIMGEKRIYNIHRDIVEKIIGDMFFRADVMDDESESDCEGDGRDRLAVKAVKKGKEKKNMMKLFVQDEEDNDWYHVEITNVARFEFAMDLVGIVLPFRQAAGAMHLAREHTVESDFSILKWELDR